ncbi:MAG: hypothetical protein NC311_11620 [Muribaculaceae bacterium]|nr:hypothetical protein [Muribaculaceae bacterium]
MNDKLNNIDTYGKVLSKSGDFLKSTNNKFANKVGDFTSNTGDFLSNGANKVQEFTTPVNYFKGHVTSNTPEINSDIFSKAMSKIGLGSAGATAGSTAGATAGTTAGAGATSGAVAGGTGGAAAGGAAGGAAAGGLIGLAIMALKGDHRKAAKKMGEQLMASTVEQSKNVAKQTEAINNDTTTQDYANQVVQESMNNIGLPQNNLSNNGMATGFASNLTDPETSAMIDENGKLLRQVVTPNLEGGVSSTFVESENQKGPNNDKRTVGDKLLSGFSDLKRGFDENYNNGFDIGNLSNNQIATDKVTEVNRVFNPESPELEAYKQKLIDSQVDPKIIEAVSQGKNGGNKEVANWLNNNQDKLYKDIPVYETKDKNKMNRVGEALGSVTRWAKNPNMQGVVAGTLGTALTGNPLYGLGLGQKIAGQRQLSNMYQQALKEQGVNVDTGHFGYIDNKDYSAMMLPKYRDALIQNRIDYQNMLGDKYQNELEEKIRHNAEMEKVNNIKAQASMIRANKTSSKGGKSSGKTTKNSNSYVIGQTPNGKRVRVPVNQVKEFKSNGGKIVG